MTWTYGSVAGVGPIVGSISAAEHMAFVLTQRSVSLLQAPGWAGVAMPTPSPGGADTST